MKTSPDDVAAALGLFFLPDEVFEIRVLGANGNPRWKRSTYCRGRDIGRMTEKIAAEADTAIAGVHFTPQGVRPEVARRSLCCLSPVGKGQKLTSDDDVPARRFLLIDIDPARAAGFEGDSATDAEKAEAWRVMLAVQEYIARCRWPAPVVVDSGNGFHAYYRMPETIHGGPVDSASDPVAILLRSLAHQYDTVGAKIDTNVFNAARTMKVPGTPSMKGPGTTERPHRMSKVVSIPEDWPTQRGEA